MRFENPTDVSGIGLPGLGIDKVHRGSGHEGLQIRAKICWGQACGSDLGIRSVGQAFLAFWVFWAFLAATFFATAFLAATG